MKLGLPSLLTLVFVIAKLLGRFPWSWWWAFAPVLIAGSIALTVILVGLLVAVIVEGSR